jgi:hypothetical protein
VVIVAAVALVGVLAIADALRSRESPASSPAGGTTTSERPPSIAETLREQLVVGHVFYSDEDCRVHSLILPEMVDQLAREALHCRLSSTNGRILEEQDRLSPNGRFIAQCSRGEIFVREAETGVVRRRVKGCAPAWRPRIGSRLTWARGEAIYERGRVLLDRSDLHALARRHPNVAQLGIPFRVRVIDLSWLDVDHLIVSLRIRARYAPPEFIAVLLEGKTVLGQTTTFQGPLEHWFASSAGSFAATADGTILTAEGERITRPDRLTRARAVAFSPDERWLAYVTGQSIYLLGTPRNKEPDRILRIPIPAQDLVWERLTASPTFPKAIQ